MPRQPRMGRQGRVKGILWMGREANDLLVYAIDNNVLQVLRVIHSKQNWSPKRY